MYNKNYTTLFLLTWIISVATVYAYDNVKTKTLLIFSASWCQYCQIAKNDINTNPNLMETIKDYEVVVLDFDLDKDAISGYNIKSVPTFVILQDNREIRRQIGYKGGHEKLNRFLK